MTMSDPSSPKPQAGAPTTPAGSFGTAQEAGAAPGSVSPPASPRDAGFGPLFDVPSSPSAAMTAVLSENWWAVVARGVAAILFGLFALFAPGATLISLALVFALYMLVDGVLGIVAAVRAARASERWGLLVLEGLVDLAAGVAALLWPGAAVFAFVILLAAWALVSGGLMFAAAFKLPKEYGRVWLILGGFASILLGVMLAVAPLIGAIVFSWWLGAYALVFGFFLIALGIKLRSRRAEEIPARTATPV